MGMCINNKKGKPHKKRMERNKGLAVAALTNATHKQTGIQNIINDNEPKHRKPKNTFRRAQQNLNWVHNQFHPQDRNSCILGGTSK